MSRSLFAASYVLVASVFLAKRTAFRYPMPS